MARVTNSDQIALALQARLQRLRKNKEPTSSATPEKISRNEATGSSRLVEILNEETLDENALARSIVSYFLEEEFGAGITDDRRFATIIHHVSELILQDDASRTLFNETIIALRARD